jgi:hypothetical protein
MKPASIDPPSYRNGLAVIALKGDITSGALYGAGGHDSDLVLSFRSYVDSAKNSVSALAIDLTKAKLQGGSDLFGLFGYAWQVFSQSACRRFIVGAEPRFQQSITMWLSDGYEFADSVDAIIEELGTD